MPLENFQIYIDKGIARTDWNNNKIWFVNLKNMDENNIIRIINHEFLHLILRRVLDREYYFNEPAKYQHMQEQLDEKENSRNWWIN